MARENVSYIRYYYKVIIGGGGGGGGGWGGGGSTCTPKGMGVQFGQRGRGCSIRFLAASAGSNCSDTTKNPNMTRKEEAQFLLPPPPPPPTHTYTHTCAGAIHKGSVFEKCFLSEVITPITLKHKICPLIPPQEYIRPPMPYPLPLCVLYHNIDSSDQWQVQGDSGGSL